MNKIEHKPININLFLEMWNKDHRALVQTLQYGAEWIVLSIREIQKANLDLNVAAVYASALKTAQVFSLFVDFFALADFAGDLKTIRVVSFNYLRGTESTKNLIITTAEVTASLSGSIRFVALAGIYEFTKNFLFRSNLIGAGALCFSCLVKSYDKYQTLSKATHPKEYYRQVVDIINNLALAALGGVLFYGVYINLIPPITVLALSTLVLGGTYAKYIIGKPPKKSDSTTNNQPNSPTTPPQTLGCAVPALG